MPFLDELEKISNPDSIILLSSLSNSEIRLISSEAKRIFLPSETLVLTSLCHFNTVLELLAISTSLTFVLVDFPGLYFIHCGPESKIRLQELQDIMPSPSETIFSFSHSGHFIFCKPLCQ